MNIPSFIKSKVFKYIIAFLVAFSIDQLFYLQSHFLNSLLIINIFVLLSIFMQKELKTKPTKKEIILTIIYSLAMGSSLYIGGMAVNDQDIFANLTTFFSKLLFIIKILGISTGIYIFLIQILDFLTTYKLPNGKQKFDTSKVFLACWIIIFVCWIPYLLSFYPGIVTSDSTSQISQALSSNFYTWNNHHPVTHTLLIKLCITIANLLSIKGNGIIAIYSILQMIILSACFAYSIAWLYNKKTSLSLLLLILMFYALHPINGYYSITMWKDIPFAACMLVFTIQIADLFMTNGNCLKDYKKIIITIISGILVGLFRNNGIYVLFGALVILLVFMRNKIKYIGITYAIPIIVVLIITGPIYSSLHIKSANITESLSIPLQQVSRTISKDGIITDAQKELIEKIAPLEKVKSEYLARISDPIKFYVVNPKIDYFNKHEKEYFYLWLQLMNKNTSIYFDSYMYSTYGYWYPFVDYWIVSNEIYEPNVIHAHRDSITPIVNKLITKITDYTQRIPVICLVWGIGFYFITTMIFMLVGILKGYGKVITIFGPIITLWLTLLMATPVFAETRYFYSIYTTAPFLCTLILTLPHKKIDKNK